MYWNWCKLITLTFFVSGLWDVVLRIMSENYYNLPTFLQDFKFIKYLIPYFEQHTILSAALIAGFVGAVTQYIILSMCKFPTDLKNTKHVLKFLLISFIISGLFGFIMKATRLFPHLEDTYYKNLGNVKGVIHDGVSGLIVQITLMFLLLVKDFLHL